jgi:hypothetical protein
MGMTTEYSQRQLHAHFLSPTRGPVAVEQFIVGYEMLSDPQCELISVGNPNTRSF